MVDLYCINIYFIDLVEARGVEPLSETVSTRASTGVAHVLVIPSVQRPCAGFVLR